MLSFVDTTVGDSKLPMGDMITIGINFINEHGGWTDNYYYAGAYPDSRQLIFQLYLFDYPVFSELGLSRLTLEISSNKVRAYERPYFTLDYVSWPTKDKKQLPSGSEIISRMENSGIDLETVDDILIGYEMKIDTDDPIILVEPDWFYRVGNQWKRVPEGAPGGAKHGLE